MECVFNVAEKRPEVVADALRNGDGKSDVVDDTDISERPPKLFYMLLGLCVETIAGGAGRVSAGGIANFNGLLGTGLRNEGDARIGRICLDSLGRLLGVGIVGRGLVDEVSSYWTAYHQAVK